MLLVFLFVSGLLLSLSLLLSLGSASLGSKSPFECGFSGAGPICSSFSIHSYQVMLVFVVFDLELCLLLGFLLSSTSGFYLFLIYLGFIYLTYYIEASLGSLVWVPILL